VSLRICKDFAEMCKILFDEARDPTILHVPRHCGAGVPGVFFSSGSWASRFFQFADWIGFCRVPKRKSVDL